MRQILKKLLNVSETIPDELIELVIRTSVILSLWFLTVAIVEYALTEYWYVLDVIETSTKTLMLIGIIGVMTLLPLSGLNRLSMHGAVMVGLIGLIGFYWYQSYYTELQRVPKIRSVSKDWSIQGDRITIEGRNFGESWQTGWVRVDKLEYRILSWDDRQVVVEQPVPVRYVTAPMVIENHYGKGVVVVDDFKIRDPGEVL